MTKGPFFDGFTVEFKKIRKTQFLVQNPKLIPLPSSDPTRGGVMERAIGMSRSMEWENGDHSKHRFAEPKIVPIKDSQSLGHCRRRLERGGCRTTGAGANIGAIQRLDRQQ